MKKMIYRISLFVVAAVFTLSGCQIAGLDFQKDYKYDSSWYENYTDLTAWEFMNSRPDLFTSMIEAVKYAGLIDEYSKPDRTYFLLSDRALQDETYVPAGVSIMGSYFGCHKILNPNYNSAIPNNGPQYIVPGNWEVFPVGQVKAFLLYHIVEGKRSYTSVSSVPEFYKSAAYAKPGDTTLVNVYWEKSRLVPLKINSFVGHRSTNLRPRTSDLNCKSGVIHVMDDYLEPPTKIILNSLKVNY